MNFSSKPLLTPERPPRPNDPTTATVRSALQGISVSEVRSLIGLKKN